MTPGGVPGSTVPERGIWQGRSVAHRIVSEDGLVILVGRTARDNDLLTLKLASPQDFWLHVAAGSGSHVVVLNPEGLSRLPRATLKQAAALAVQHSKGKRGGQTAVHVTARAQVRKPRGYPPGKVALGRHDTVLASPAD